MNTNREIIRSSLVLASDTFRELAEHPAFADNAPEFNEGGCGYEAHRAVEKAIRLIDKEKSTETDLAEALLACLPDLEHYVSTHGPGPDKRLESARAALAKAGIM
jgi:hypothetical protein